MFNVVWFWVGRFSMSDNIENLKRECEIETNENQKGKSSNKRRCWNWTVILQAVTLIVGLLGGIGGFWFIDRLKLQESNANKLLAETQNRILTEIGANQSKVQFSADLIKALSSIRPALTIELDKEQSRYEKRSSTLLLYIKLTNNGTHFIEVEGNPELIFWEDSFVLNNLQSKNRIEENDYHIESNQAFAIPPGESGNTSVEVVFKRPIKKLSGYLHYTATIDPKVKETFKKILEGIVDANEINELATGGSRLYLTQIPIIPDNRSEEPIVGKRDEKIKSE
jgi:hypothetical protein